MTCSEHGLEPVALDLNWETLGPSRQEIKEKLSRDAKERWIKAVIFSFPYGIKYNIEPLALLCKQYNIAVIKDAGESFKGTFPKDCPYADITMFSNGMLKHNTAFGGAVSIVRFNDDLYQQMLNIDKSYEIESSYSYLYR